MRGGEDMKKIISGVVLFLATLFLVPSVFAHVSVKPNEVGVGKYQTFTMGVPVEKDIPTTGLRLVIPEGLQHVTPNVKPGWTISMKKSGQGEEEMVTEVSWTGGVIPAGQRDDFSFSAQVPGEATTLMWKAYQTYQDGTVVAWDQDPKAEQHKDADGHADFSTMGPYSETKIVNDLVSTQSQSEKKGEGMKMGGKSEKSMDSFALLLSVVALAVAGTSLWFQFKGKKK